MESLLIWVLMLALVALVVVRYTRGFTARRHADRDRLRQTRELGMDKATGQYPLVDAGACPADFLRSALPEDQPNPHAVVELTRV